MQKYQSIAGNVGLGKAIEFFTSQGVHVSIPLNDTQGYDLIADINDKLYRVQIKTCTFKRGNSYIVGLKTAGGNSYYSNGKNYTIKNFDNKRSDLLFIYTSDGKLYLIPTSEINVKSAISVGGDNTKKYEVTVKKLSEL